MGDRANIVIETKNQKGDPTPLFIYSHWNGFNGMFQKLRVALKKRERWNDESYLTRIIFDTVIGKEQGQTTGYGIGLSLPDNEHPYICVDVEAQMVHIRPGVEHDNYSVEAPPIKSWTFEQFASPAPIEWEVIQS